MREINRLFHPGEDVSSLLRELLPDLLQEIITYGKFAQATYDASDKAGDCSFVPQTFFHQSGLSDFGYEVTGYLYALSAVKLPRWVRYSLHVGKQCKWSNWMGFVAVSSDGETRRTGYGEIVVAWCGTATKSEWCENVRVKMKRLQWGENSHVCKVETGFHRLYTSKDASTQHNETSASEQVMAEIRRLASAYADRGETVNLSLTGHSLGGALALLNAHEAADARIGGLGCVTVISFGAPSVGNLDFKQCLEKRGVKTLRVVIRRDLVPKLPGLLGKLEKLVPREKRKLVYVHAGHELMLVTKLSWKHIVRNHNMITYLHQLEHLKRELENPLR